MGDVSKHFNRSEFACKCGCGFMAVDIQLLDILEDLRTRFNSPMIITSACRCASHNKKVGGASKSQHLNGMAVDFTVKGLTAQEVQREIDKWFPNSLTMGYGKTFTHMDVRKGGKLRFNY